MTFDQGCGIKTSETTGERLIIKDPRALVYFLSKAFMAEDKNSNWWQKGVTAFARLSAWIAVPVVVGAILGRWLDKKFQTEPWLFLGTIGFMFFVSMFGLIKEAVKEFKILSKEDGDKRDDKLN